MQSSTDFQSIPIPKKIHYIWVGGPIPKEYLINMILAAKVAQDSGIELNVWVDDEKNIYKTLQKINSGTLEIPQSNKIAGIQIRNINELLPRMKEDAFLKEGDRYKQIQNYIRREMIGFKNLAAASDLLRYVILLLEGGCYLDTDNELIIIKDNNGKNIKTKDFIEQSLISGFQVNGSYYGSFNHFDALQFAGGNDIINTIPQHPIIKDTIDISLKNYKQLDQNSAYNCKVLGLSPDNELSEMDEKRWPYSINGNTNSTDGNENMFCSGRMALTMECAAGPRSLCDAVIQFWQKYLKIETDSEKHFEMLDAIESAKKKLPIKSESHMTWLKTPAKRSPAFDTSSLRGTLFSLPNSSSAEKGEDSRKNSMRKK